MEMALERIDAIVAVIMVLIAWRTMHSSVKKNRRETDMQAGANAERLNVLEKKVEAVDKMDRGMREDMNAAHKHIEEKMSSEFRRVHERVGVVSSRVDGIAEKQGEIIGELRAMRDAR